MEITSKLPQETFCKRLKDLKKIKNLEIIQSIAFVVSFVPVVYAWIGCKNGMDCISKQILTLLLVNRGGFVLIFGFSKPACFLSGCFNGSHAISALAYFSGPYHKDEMHKLGRRINITYSNYYITHAY